MKGENKMIRNLKREVADIYYIKDGQKILINRQDKNTYPDGISGVISSRLYGVISSGLTGVISSGLSGVISSRLYGDISELSGIISIGLYGVISSELSGDISGGYGDVSNLSGNIDSCEITDEERKAGININDLIREKIK